MELSRDCYQLKQLFIWQEFGLGTSLAVQWLRFCTPDTGGMGSIPGQVTEILHAAGCVQKKKKKKKNLI